MRLLSPILANFILIAAAFGVGTLLRPLFPARFSRVDRIATILLGGLGILGTLLFLVGLIRFSSFVVFIVLLPGALLGLLSLRGELKGSALHFRFSEIPRIPMLVVALLLVLTFVGGLAAPVGDIKMDAIAYHLLGPRVWLRSAVIHPLPDECLTAFPANVETLFAALMAVGGARAPELFAFVSIGGLLLVAYGFAVRLGLGSPGAWWAVALITTMPVVYRGAYGAFVDAIFSSFVLLSLRLALDAQEPGEYLLAGMFGGLAMGAKYTGLPAFFLIFVAAAALAWVRQSVAPVKLFSRFFLLAATAALVASPWYLRNWLALGSPIYPPPPRLLHYFQIKYMSPQAIGALAALVRKEGLGMGHGLSSLLLLPFHLTFHPANFLNGPGGVGVCLLALAPFGFLLRWRDPFVGVLGFFGFVQTLTWFVTEQDARFLIHIYVLLAIFAVWGWRYVSANAPRFGPVLAGASVACSILYGLIMIIPARLPDVHAALSSNYERQRELQEIPYLDGFAFLNADPSVKKVLVLEPRVPTFYLRKDYLKPVGRFGEQTIPEGNDFSLLAGKLSSYGITHVFDVRLDDNDIHRDFRIDASQPNLVLVYERADQRIYRVISAE